jgi:hypothetical protein
MKLSKEVLVKMYSTSKAFNIRCQEMQTSFFVRRSCLRSRRRNSNFPQASGARVDQIATNRWRSPTHTCKRTRSTHAKSLFFNTAKRCRRARATNLPLYRSISSYLNGPIFEPFAPCDRECEIRRGATNEDTRALSFALVIQILAAWIRFPISGAQSARGSNF